MSFQSHYVLPVTLCSFQSHYVPSSHTMFLPVTLCSFQSHYVPSSHTVSLQSHYVPSSHTMSHVSFSDYKFKPSSTGGCQLIKGAKLSPPNFCPEGTSYPQTQGYVKWCEYLYTYMSIFIYNIVMWIFIGIYLVSLFCNFV